MKRTETVLVINTSFKGASIAVADLSGVSFQLLAMNHFFSNQVAAARLPGLIQWVLNQSGIELENIDHTLVDTGPGSFTGIKVGLAFASGFFSGMDRGQLWGLSGLESLAHCHGQSEWFLPATKTQGYLARYEDTGARIYSVELEDGKILIADEEKRERQSYEALHGRRIALMQPWQALEQELKGQGQEHDKSQLGVVGGAIIHSMVDYFQEFRHTLASGSLQPRYIRKSAPEEALNKKGGSKT